MSARAFIILLLAALLLIGCTSAAPESTEHKGTIVTYPAVPTAPSTTAAPKVIAVTPSGTTKSDDELIQTADQVLSGKYGIDLSHYNVHVNHYDNAGAEVCYSFSMYGYSAVLLGDISAYFHADGTLYRIYDDSEEILRYIPYITEEAVLAAATNLDQQAKAYKDVNRYSYQIDQDGYLCLGVEILVEYEPTQTDSEGNPIHGCGFDHDHIFLRERICQYQ